MAKQFIYIVQASLEPSKCKIGKTNDLERRLKEYNNMTGKSKDNIYHYLFTCEVKDMAKIENDIKKELRRYREENKTEMYFYNKEFFEDYLKYIKSHKLFVKEIFIKAEDKKQVVKIIKKTTPTLEERGVKMRDILQKAKKLKNDEFYTRYEDIEKELEMYDKEIWENKTVFCNCDDAVDEDERRTSAFAIYFLRNFKKYKLKKLICTHFSGDVDLFNQGSKGYIFTKYGFKEIEQKKEYPKDYNGSFDHPLSVKLLNEEADIVCTNPPFSKCIEYWDLL
ncbi:MAG: GIY-YIG nuclease family protein, partial [Treponema sp.]|nr:GIY-YIG nuclease family protein [Treponema sp.]